jgi:hypothetical protein
LVDLHLCVRSWRGSSGKNCDRKHCGNADVPLDRTHGKISLSALQRLVDDGKPLLSAFEGDVGDDEGADRRCSDLFPALRSVLFDDAAMIQLARAFILYFPDPSRCLEACRSE